MMLARKFRVPFFAVAACAAFWNSAPVWAHPHSWIDITTTVVLSAPGTIRSIRQDWLFDEFYTSSIVREKGSTAAALASFARDALVNLAPYEFFTHLSSDGGLVKVLAPVSPSAHMQGKRLAFEFELPLQTAADLGQSKLRLSVYDPTYYIEMLHGDVKAINFTGPDAEKCKATIMPAKPSEETKKRAFQMDRQATPDHGLGEKFAERVELSCD